MQRAKPRYVHGVCRPDESFRHNQQRWFMADTTKDWLPWPVCRHHTVIPRRDGGPCTRSRTNVRAILGNNWYQARLCDGPLLYILVFSAMLNDAFHDNDLWALIRFRTDGNVFNIRRLNSKTRTSKVLIRALLFPDDRAHTVDDIQAITNAFARSAVSDWRSVWRKQRWFISQSQEQTTQLQPSQSTKTHWKSLKSSHTWAARYHRIHWLTTISRHGLAKRAGCSANSPSASGANAECG